MLKRFIGDDRGVMMMVGAVAGAFLIGAVWFIWGVGQAAVFRENMQSAADATAFQMSVYDARGMNIIAMINLIMSVVLTVLVVLRIVQAVVIAVNIISCIFGAFLNPICDATSLAEPEITTFVDETATVISKILTGLSLTESGASIIWPFFASGTSTAVSANYKPTVNGTIGVGSSNIPLQSATDLATQVGASAIDLSGAPESGKAVSVKNIKNSFKPGENGVFCNFDGKFLLPTQNDDYANLCARAGANVAFAFAGLIDLVLTPFKGIPGVGFVEDEINKFFTNTVAPLLGALVGQFTSFFCEDDSGLLFSIADKLVSASGQGGPVGADIEAKCDAKKNSAVNGQPKKTVKPGEKPSAADDPAKVATALKNCKETARRAKKAANKTKGSGQFAETCSKTLNDGSTMLEQDFQNWGFSFGSYADVSGGIVGTATALNPKGGGKASKASTGADMQIAQSEFYYEPKTAGETQDKETANTTASVGGAVGGLESGLDNYMYNMRWRARLRRVRAPSIGLGNAAAGIIGQAASQVTGTKDSKILSKGVDLATDFLTSPLKDKGEIVVGGELVKPEMVH